MSLLIKSREDAQYEFNVFTLVVDQGNGSNIELYVSQIRADWEAKRLSALMPDRTITLQIYARIKAVYKNGQRVMVKDFKEFYNNLTPEQYSATQIIHEDAGGSARI